MTNLQAMEAQENAKTSRKPSACKVRLRICGCTLVLCGFPGIGVPLELTNKGASFFVPEKKKKMAKITNNINGGNQMNIKMFLHAPSHLFLLILLGILGIVAVGWLALAILFLSIIELLILSLNKLYRYKNGEWIIVSQYKICNVCIAALTIAICLFFIFLAK